MLALMGFCAFAATAATQTTTTVSCQPASVTVGSPTTCTATASNGPSSTPSGTATR